MSTQTSTTRPNPKELTHEIHPKNSKDFPIPKKKFLSRDIYV
jgi:hypothetical protein